MKHLLKASILFLFTFYQGMGTCQQIPTVNLVMKDGLSSYYVTDITQDKSGFMWFATKYGLNRYDGNKFTVYLKNPEQKILNSNDICKIIADTIHNKVWIANRWSGINIFDCETESFTSFMHDEENASSLISNEINDILITSQGDIWIATDKGLDKFDRVKEQFIHYNSMTVPGFPSSGINILAEGDEGIIYLGHKFGGFSIFSPITQKVKNFKHIAGNKNSLPNDMIHSIFKDRESKIWIATDKGLSLFEPRYETFRNFVDIKNIHPSIQGVVLCVFHTSDGRIWAGTTCDLCYFDSRDLGQILSGKKDVHHMFIQDIYWGISNPTVLCIFEDTFRNIWIGSNGGGISFISNTSTFFQSWRIDKIPGVVNGLNDKEVLTICIDKDENIWMGTDGGGINVNKNGKNCEFYSSKTGEVSSNTYYSSLKDSNNDLWFGNGSSGIDIFKSKENKFIHYTIQGNSSPIYCFYEDNHKNVWIGSNNGLESYNLETKEKSFLNQENSNLLTNSIRAVSQDKNGNIWIGSLHKGITIYNPENKEMTHFSEEAIFQDNQINQIFKDSKNRMWLATTEGLVLFKEAKFNNYQIFDSKNGLSSNMVCAIEEDLDGNIWVSTNIGISCLIEPENKFLNYNHTDGALFGTYMPNSVAKSGNAIIYFGSINGVCYFNPLDRPVNITLPPVTFTDFKVHRRNPQEDALDISLPIKKHEITLKHNQNIFSVSFNVMDKSLQGKVEYAYKLDGLTNTWTNLNGENKVTFHNIPPNYYKLHIRARFKNQEWQDDYSTLSIIVNPPLWMTWWAKLLYLTFFFLIVFLLIKSYKRRLQLKNSLILEKEKVQKQQELNEERLRFYTNITHELRTPLTLILGPLEDLQNDSEIQPEHKHQLSLIHKSSNRLLNLVTRILEFRKTETQNKKLQIDYADISDKIFEIGFKYKELNKNINVRFDIIIDTSNTKLYFDQEVITMIIDNLLSNAFKYTYNGIIMLTLRSVTEDDIDYTEIEVSDTGMGIPKEELSYIFERYYQVNKRKNNLGFGIGLALVKNLIDLHEGIILVGSEINVGSSFRVRLITNNTYPEAIHIRTLSKDEAEIEEEKINKPIVLVVEDDDDIRNYVFKALMNSYDVIVAGNGAQGLIAAQTNIPDIIISDIMMPIMDGIELCKLIKANVETSHIPVILLTAKDTLQDKTEGYGVGADSYITKPFSASLLKSRVSNLLDTRRKIASLLFSNTSLKRSIIKDSLNKIDNEFIEKIMLIIEKNLMHEKIDVITISQELSMSYSSLYRKVKALTGLPVGEFIRKIRMKKAEELLLSGKYNISEVANLVGLNSTSYFRECFKEEYGEAPSDYIKRIKGI